MIELAQPPIDFDDTFPLSVGTAKDAERYWGRMGRLNGFEVSLNMAADNIAKLDKLVGGDDIRWMMVTTHTAQIPFDREWKAITPLIEVENISMAHKMAARGIECDGFEGKVDYILINYIKHARKVICACFDNENDAILWKMRQPAEGGRGS